MAGGSRRGGGGTSTFPTALSPADRKPSEAQMKTVLLSIGLTQDTVDELVDVQGLKLWSDYDDMEDADIDQMVKSCSSRSSDAVNIPLKESKLIKGIAYTHNLLVRMQRKTRCTKMDTNVLGFANLQHKVDKNWKDGEVRITPFDPNKEKEPAEYLRRLRPLMDLQRGVLMTPMSYLIREHGEVEDEDDEESALWSNEDFPSIDEELIRRSPIYDPTATIDPVTARLQGPWAESFLTDCRKGLPTLITAFGKSDVRMFAKEGFDKGNPRLIFILLHDYFHGPGYVVVEQSTIRQTLDSLRYSNDTRSVTFVNVLGKLRHLFNQAETLAKTSKTAFNGIGVDPFEKCSILQRVASGCPALVATVTVVRAKTEIAGNYEEQEKQIMAGYRAMCETNLREGGTNRSKVAAIGTGGGGGGGGGKNQKLNSKEIESAKRRLAKYANPKVRVPDEEYAAFTAEEKYAKYLLNQEYQRKHPKTPGGGGGGSDGTSRSARRRANSKARVNELQTQLEQVHKRLKSIEGAQRDDRGGDNSEFAGRQQGPARRHNSDDE
jgi:hypothetical protein